MTYNPFSKELENLDEKELLTLIDDEIDGTNR